MHVVVRKRGWISLNSNAALLPKLLWKKCKPCIQSMQCGPLFSMGWVYEVQLGSFKALIALYNAAYPPCDGGEFIELASLFSLPHCPSHECVLFLATCTGSVRLFY